MNLKAQLQLLRKRKNVLVVTDMLKGFLKFGDLSDEYINHITEEVIRLIKLFNSNGDEIIEVVEAHKKDAKEFKILPPHCIEGTEEAETIDEIAPYKKNMKLVKKNCTCGFITKEFLKYMKKNKNKIKTIVVVGCCTDICVLNFIIALTNFINEYNLDIEIIVPMNAVETYDKPWHNREEYNDMAFKFMKQAGVTLVKKYGGD